MGSPSEISLRCQWLGMGTKCLPISSAWHHLDRFFGHDQTDHRARRIGTVTQTNRATDASEAMLSLAHSHAPGATEIRRLTLPVDSIPPADAIVGVGHALNYLDGEAQVDEALVAIATALRPGGIMAIDLCDLEWGAVHVNQPPKVWRTDDWALMTEFSLPRPNRYVRRMTTFVRQDGGIWRRDDERHENVLIDTTKVPDLLARHGIDATVSESFGDERSAHGRCRRGWA